MRKVQRDELVDYQTWSDSRTDILPEMLEFKKSRRVHVGKYLTFLFENAATIRYQIQEMMRVERIVRDKDIEHELHTYNEIIGDEGELGCVLLIEIADEGERAVKLVEWLDLPRHLYALAGGERFYATYDERQVGEDRVSSVQYLKFDTKGQTPTALGSDHPALIIEAPLTESQRAALSSDLDN